MPRYRRKADGTNVELARFRRKADGTNAPVGPQPGQPDTPPPPPPSLYAPSRRLTFQPADLPNPSDPLSQWTEVFGRAPSIIDSGHPLWPKAARFQFDANTRASWEASDPDISRTEVSLYGDTSTPVRGTRRVYAWSVRFPANLKPPRSWLAVWDHHHRGAKCPTPFWANVMQDVSTAAPRLGLITRGGRYTPDACSSGITFSRTFELGVIPLGQWLDLEFDVLHHDDAQVGRITIKRNGVVIHDNQPAATLYNSAGPGTSTLGLYPQVGAYGNLADRGAYLIDHAGYREGPTPASVAR